MNEPTMGWIVRATSLAVAGVAAGVLFWMLSSQVFDVRTVEVFRADMSPPPAIDPARIEARAQQMLGHNIFRVDPGSLRNHLRDIPGVADTVVTLSIDGRVRVTVSYEAPVANWVVEGQSYLVNSDGEILAARYQPDLELTVEDGLKQLVGIGDRISLDALHAAYQLQSNLPLLRVLPSRIRYSGSGLLVVDHSGRELQFGDTGQLAAKLVALQSVLDEAGRRGERIASIDLRPVDRPTYRTVDAPPVISTLGVPP